MRAPALARFGDALRRHRRIIAAMQWLIVGCYAVLVTVPAFLALPPAGAHILSNLTLLAQFAFWGIWWPSVIASMMLVGRAWCGLFCPEGTVTEWASRHGLGRRIPRWMRWSGWPFAAFAITTVYGQLISVYEYPKAVLLILGGSTLGAAVVGFVYGKGTRVWCRYLCPVNGVFDLLARVAPVHFGVDEAAWKAYPLRTANIECAPMVDLRHLHSASACHACGRCSGHRNAIALAARSPNREILSLRPSQAGTASALLLVFGVLGIALGAFQWTVSPWFVAMKQALATWLVGHDHMALLADHAPWWLLTHYPQAGDVFAWLDGLCIVAYIAGVAAVVGGATFGALALAARLAGRGRFDWRVLAMSLIPLGGVSLILGLSMLTLAQLRAEHVLVPGLDFARGTLLALGLAWSGWLGGRIIGSGGAAGGMRAEARALHAVPLLLVGLAWYLVLWGW
jgi:polyferredoxin